MLNSAEILDRYHAQARGCGLTHLSGVFNLIGNDISALKLVEAKRQFPIIVTEPKHSRGKPGHLRNARRWFTWLPFDLSLKWAGLYDLIFGAAEDHLRKASPTLFHPAFDAQGKLFKPLWAAYQRELALNLAGYAHYLVADVEEFYANVTPLTIEQAFMRAQCLPVVAETVIEVLKQMPHGLPIGHPTSELIAAVILSDLACCLQDTGFTARMWMDDMLIGLESSDHDQVASALINQSLSRVGLRLNEAKTAVYEEQLGWLIHIGPFTGVDPSRLCAEPPLSSWYEIDPFGDQPVPVTHDLRGFFEAYNAPDGLRAPLMAQAASPERKNIRMLVRESPEFLTDKARGRIFSERLYAAYDVANLNRINELLRALVTNSLSKSPIIEDRLFALERAHPRVQRKLGLRLHWEGQLSPPLATRALFALHPDSQLYPDLVVRSCSEHASFEENLAAAIDAEYDEGETRRFKRAMLMQSECGSLCCEVAKVITASGVRSSGADDEGGADDSTGY
ncbi:MAG: hypothetical protein JNK63_01405 [Chthonomonas sp.]|nr:hypothetical protein [Chthonomonas sp.]